MQHLFNSGTTPIVSVLIVMQILLSTLTGCAICIGCMTMLTGGVEPTATSHNIAVVQSFLWTTLLFQNIDVVLADGVH